MNPVQYSETVFATRRINATDLQDVVDAFTIGQVDVRRASAVGEGKLLTDFHNLSSDDLQQIVVRGRVNAVSYLVLTLGKSSPAVLTRHLRGISANAPSGNVGQDDFDAMDKLEAEVIRILTHRGHREPDGRQAFTIAGVGAFVLAAALLVWAVVAAIRLRVLHVPSTYLVQGVIFLALVLAGITSVAIGVTRIYRSLYQIGPFGSVRISPRTRSGARDTLGKIGLLVLGACLGAALGYFTK